MVTEIENDDDNGLNGALPYIILLLIFCIIILCCLRVRMKNNKRNSILVEDPHSKSNDLSLTISYKGPKRDD